MSRLILCSGEGCPLKEGCHRFLSLQESRDQMFFEVVPYNEDEKYCDYYWPVIQEDDGVADRRG